jgi:hypothetical protein
MGQQTHQLGDQAASNVTWENSFLAWNADRVLRTRSVSCEAARESSMGLSKSKFTPGWAKINCQSRMGVLFERGKEANKGR